MYVYVCVCLFYISLESRSVFLFSFIYLFSFAFSFSFSGVAHLMSASYTCLNVAVSAVVAVAVAVADCCCCCCFSCCCWWWWCGPCPRQCQRHVMLSSEVRRLKRHSSMFPIPHTDKVALSAAFQIPRPLSVLLVGHRRWNVLAAAAAAPLRAA